MKIVSSIEELESVYGEPVDRSLWKEIDHINDHYRIFIEKSPFLILATSGETGIDYSPRGDSAGFVSWNLRTRETLHQTTASSQQPHPLVPIAQ